MCYNSINGKGEGSLAMSEREDEMTGKEINNLIHLQAEEGKTPTEAIEALLKVVGGEMPEPWK